MRVDLMHRVTVSAVPALFLSLALLVAAAPGVLAQAPQRGGAAELLAADPVLEERVTELSHKLRCLVCQNQSIAESNAPLAVDLRNQVREQLAAGKNEDQVIDYLVARYGDFVLYLPPVNGITLLLWVGPGLLLFSGAGWLALRLRRRADEPAAAALNNDQRNRARALLDGAPLPPEEPRS